MLQAHVLNVSPVSDTCCSKCFILQVFLLVDAGSGRRWLHVHAATCVSMLQHAYAQQQAGIDGQARASW
jgi:hypothetical protein